MNSLNTMLRSLAFLFALIATSSTAQLISAPLAGDSAQRTGVLNHINAQERSIVIDDQNYQLAASAQLTAAVTARTGKRVRYTVVGEGGGRRGVIVAVEPAGKETGRNRE